MRMILSAAVIASMALAVANAGERAGSGERQVALVIESGTLADALDQWARQTGFQLLSPSWDVAKQLVAPALKGTFAPREALEQLLKGTPLVYEVTSERTVTVRAKLTASSRTTGSLERTDVRRLQVAQLSAAEGGSDQSRVLDAGASTRSTTTQSKSGLDDRGKLEELEEIVVTGTHIRGSAPIGSSLLVIDRQEIERSGRGRAQDILEVLPQNFSGSAGERFQADNKAANNTRGQAIDLRGLGASSTLVLINGRRQPSGGLEGAFVDISSIPTAAIQRVEVLPDGASALYGADAVGGVVNFVLRKDYDGLETGVRYGSIAGAADEVQAFVVGGTNWADGNVIYGYQYSEREALMAGDTFYGARNNDFRSLGGDDFRSFGGNPGTITDPSTFAPAYAIPRGQDGTNLTADDLIPGQNFQDDVTGFTVEPEQRQHSAFFAVSQSLSERLSVFAEGRYGKRKMTFHGVDELRFAFVPESNPHYLNPFGDTGPVVVAYNFGRDFDGNATQISDTETFAFTVGASAALAAGWALNVAASRGEETNDWEFSNIVALDRLDMCLSGLPDSGCPGSPLNLFGDAVQNDPVSINFIRDGAVGRGVSKVRSLNAIADGPLLQLPAGALKLAVGADYRNERLNASRSILIPASGEILSDLTSTVGDFDRDVTAVFAEVAVPILGQRGSDAAQIELSLAGRYEEYSDEEYSDFGSTTNPKIGLSFTPVDGATLRASWGTSFRAPRFNELSTTSNPSQAFLFPGLPDPNSPSGESNVIFIGGADPDLQPETAHVWTAGVDLGEVEWMNGFTVSATYFEVDYEDKIQPGGEGFFTLLLEDQWAEVITRNPTPEQIAAQCVRPDFFGDCSQPVAAIIDGRLRNFGGLRVTGIDFNLGYLATLPLGQLTFGLAGVHTLTYERAVSSSAPFVDVLDTVGNPLALKLRGSIGWDFDAWSVNAYINHAGGYRDTAFNRSVDAWTTIDLGIAYRASGGWLAGTRFRLSALNLFDKEPPFVNKVEGFDAANTTQEGRSVSVNIVKEW